jgi:hypothetical protein
MTRIMTFWTAFALALLVSAAAQGERITVDVSSNALTTHTSTQQGYGDYYVLDLDLPEGITVATLDGAYLEVILDVDAREVADFRDNTPIFEVYGLSGTLSGEPTPNQFMTTDVPIVRNVALGDNRRVVVEITELVKTYLTTPSAKHGLILGSLTRRRDGLFTVKTGVGGMTGPVRLTFFTR